MKNLNNCKIILLVLSLFSYFKSQTYILGSQNQLNALAVQSDGNIIGGGFCIVNNVQQFLVARYTSAGILDTTFGTDGIQTTLVGTLPSIYAVELDSSNNIIVAGSALVNEVGYMALARYLPSGILDTSFGTNGVVLASFELGCSCYAMVIESDDKIILTGSILKDDEVWIPLVRYNADGTLDTTFGTNGLVVIELEDCAVGYSIIRQSDGKYIVVGFAEGQSFVVRVNSDGTLDTTFGTNGATTIEVGNSSFLRGSDLQSTGKIVVAGYSEGQCLIARLNTDGSLDTSFGSSGITLNKFGAQNILFDMVIDASDRVSVIGASDDTAILSRYSSTGILDATFGNSGLASVICGVIGNSNAIKIQADGKIIGAGFSDNNGLVVRVDTNGIFDMTFGANGLVLDPTDYFPTCVADSSGSSNAYAFAFDTTNQTTSIASSFQDVTFNSNAQLLGWAHSTGTAIFTCNSPGVYQITYAASSETIANSGLISSTLRLTKNDTEIPGSQQTFEYATNNQISVQSKTIITTFSQNDVLKLQYAGSSTACRLIAGEGIGTTRPSVALTIMQLS